MIGVHYRSEIGTNLISANFLCILVKSQLLLYDYKESEKVGFDRSEGS
jgi:hypothetical protein